MSQSLPPGPVPTPARGRLRDPAAWLFAAALVLGLGFRCVDLTEWPFFFFPTVQYESALTARAIWVWAEPSRATPDQLAWFREIGFGHVTSPPVLPALTALCYHVAGEEIPWASKIPAAGCWMLAGWFVYLTVGRFTGSRLGAACSFAWFVLAPYGLSLSRSFQAEPVLMLGFAAGVYSLSLCTADVGWGRTVLTGLVCGLAGLSKPVILCAPFGLGFAGALCQAGGGRPGSKFARLAVFGVLMTAPSLCYGGLMLAGHLGDKVMPRLLLEPWFYLDVARSVHGMVGLYAFVLGAAGWFLSLWTRRLVVPGLLLGYGAYVMIFTWHCATHVYYHAPLLVLVAVGLGHLVEPVERYATRWPVARRVPSWAVVVLALGGLTVFVVKSRVGNVGPWRWSARARPGLATIEARQTERVARYAAVREAIGAGGRALTVDDEYGFSLEFYGMIRTMNWPRRSDQLWWRLAGIDLADPARVESRLREFAPFWSFFVVTDLEEFDRNPELRDCLARLGRPVSCRPGVLIFDLRPLGCPPAAGPTRAGGSVGG